MRFSGIVSMVVVMVLGEMAAWRGVLAAGTDDDDDEITAPVVAGTREARFPSRDERVRLYMSNWYSPPCPDYNEGRVRFEMAIDDDDNKNATGAEESWPRLWVAEPMDRINASTFVLESRVEPDKIFFLHEKVVQDCGLNKSTDPKLDARVVFRQNMRMYCFDVATTLLTASTHVDWDDNAAGLSPKVPTILQFGDLKHSHGTGFVNIPHIKKFRSGATREALQQVTSEGCHDGPRPLLNNSHQIPHLQPIIWKLATSRHFRLLTSVYRHDTPWNKKANMAVFRGQLTGSREGYDPALTDEQNCLRLRRCRLVYRHFNSTLVHARLTSTRNRLPSVLNGVPLLESAVTIRKLLQFKAIVMLEGNDVASGLKWALLSQSVVLMPPPRHTSWAMEELLEPWVHYVPLNENATDVEEKMQWVVNHDDAAQRIAERGTLWMEDMVFHPDAMLDDRWIQEEIIRRYRAHFIPGAVKSATTNAIVSVP